MGLIFYFDTIVPFKSFFVPLNDFFVPFESIFVPLHFCDLYHISVLSFIIQTSLIIWIQNCALAIISVR